MIVRIMEEGQFAVPDDALPRLNELDDKLTQAVESGDDALFSQALEVLLNDVRTKERLPDDFLGASDLVLPPVDSTIDEVRALLGDEGLIPG
jgi:PspAA-like protein